MVPHDITQNPQVLGTGQSINAKSHGMCMYAAFAGIACQHLQHFWKTQFVWVYA